MQVLLQGLCWQMLVRHDHDVVSGGEAAAAVYNIAGAVKRVFEHVCAERLSLVSGRGPNRPEFPKCF